MVQIRIFVGKSSEVEMDMNIWLKDHDRAIIRDIVVRPASGFWLLAGWGGSSYDKVVGTITFEYEKSDKKRTRLS